MFRSTWIFGTRCWASLSSWVARWLLSLRGTSWPGCDGKRSTCSKRRSRKDPRLGRLDARGGEGLGNASASDVARDSTRAARRRDEDRRPEAAAGVDVLGCRTDGCGGEPDASYVAVL